MGREDGEMPWIRALCSRCGEYETVYMACENVGKWGMRRKQGWLCGINRARRTVRARQAWCRHNPGLENDNSTRVEHARQRVKTGQGVLKQKSPDSFSARGSLSSSPDRACTIEGGQSCGLERFSIFEEGTPCVEGKKYETMEVHLCQAPGTPSSAISRDLHTPRAWHSLPSAVAASQYARR